MLKQKCAVWGTRAAGRQLAEQAAELGYEPLAYCSSTPASQGKRIGGLPVVSPEELRRLYEEKEISSVLLGVKNPAYVKEIEEAVSQMPPLDMAAILAETDMVENAWLESARKNMQYRWEIPFEEQAAMWLQNFTGEAESWERDDADPRGFYHSVYLERLNNTDFCGINAACQDLAQCLGAGSVVMDIGCGLVSKYGTRLPNGEQIRLLAVDPLAPFYNRINRKYAGGGRPCAFGLFEFIADFYEEDYCDAVLIDNALDHCIDPFRSVVECLYILKPGGTLRLTHRRAEAVYEAYQGLHKWNVDYGGEDELILWNQENAVNVSERLKGIADIKIHHMAEQRARSAQMMTADVVKKRDFQLEEFLDMAQERRQLAFLVEGLMDRTADCHEKARLEILQQSTGR